MKNLAKKIFQNETKLFTMNKMKIYIQYKNLHSI